MRKSGSWMTIWDDRLLEWAEENDSVSASAVTDTDYFSVSQPHISRRLRKLANHGMLQDLGNGVYSITDEGKAYLEGNLNANTLEDASEENSSHVES